MHVPPGDAVPHSTGYRPRDPDADRVLVARIREGDADAFARVYLEFHDRLLEFAYGLLGPSDGAKDVVQDVFARLWERRTEWRGEGRLDVYLYRAVRYRVLDSRRRERVVRTHHARDAIDSTVSLALGTLSADPEAALQSQELEIAVQRALERLPVMEQQTVLLRWRHGLSNGEIADVLERPTSAIATYISRAKRVIRELIVGA